MADLATGNSGYQVGAIDTATTQVNDDPVPLKGEISASKWNGLAHAIVQMQTILGIGTDLKGSKASLAERLAILLNTDGTFKLSGPAATINYGVLATSPTEYGSFNHAPVGMVMPYAGLTVPAHWLECNGQAVSRATYSKLFATISTQYGAGDGSTTFNVPDLRGRTVIMRDTAGLRVNASSLNGGNAIGLGGAGGSQIHTLSVSELPAHTHSYGSNSGGGATGGDAGGPFDAGAGTTGSTGSGAAHNNMPPWMALNYIIFAQA